MKTLHIKPGNLLNDGEFLEFKNMLFSRESSGVNFKVDLEETVEMNLSKFNTLVKLYVTLRRSGKQLTYLNTQHSVSRYVDKTNFHHVFSK